MRAFLSAAEIAERRLPGMPTTKAGVLKLAQREGWYDARDVGGRPLTRDRQARGGGQEFHYKNFTAPAQLALVAEAHRAGEADVPAGVPATIEPEPEGYSDKAALRRDARLTILSCFDAYRLSAGLPVKAAAHQFAALYNAGGVESVPAWVRAAVKQVSAPTIERWRSTRRSGSFHQLGGRYKSRKGCGVLDSANGGEVAAFIGALIVKQPHLTAAHIRDLVRDRFGAELSVAGEARALPPLRTFQWFVGRWREDNADALMLLTDPDRYKSARRIAGHDMNAHVERPGQLWEIDASPADVLLLDGRYSLYVVTDIWTRRQKALVSKTAKTQAALLLVRAAILAWGVPEALRTDEGSDFKSHEFKRALSSLGILHDMCPPFSPERKGSVERGIGTLQRGLMPLLPGFIGHSVADRKAIEARRSFAQRLGESPEAAFCIEMSAEDLQARCDSWLEQKYAHSPHKGIDGATPFERAASWRGPVRRIENERALDLLLAPIAGKDGYRVPTKQGIRLDGGWFLHGALPIGERVLCRHDPADAGRLYVFSTEGGAYICTAECAERLGIDPRETVARAKAVQKRLMAERVEPLKAAIKRIKPSDLYEGVMRTAAEDSAALVAFPARGETHTTADLEAAGEALDRSATEPAPMTPELKRAQLAVIADLEARESAPARREDDPLRRFQRALAIRERLDVGQPVGEADLAWWRQYSGEPEYRAYARMYEIHGREMFVA